MLKNRIAAVAPIITMALVGCPGSENPPPGESGSETGGAPWECVPNNPPVELFDCSTIANEVNVDICTPCLDECSDLYFCAFFDGTEPAGGCPICATSDIAADNICRSEDFLNVPDAYAQKAPCNLNSNCTGWNPSAQVTVNAAGALEIPQAFIDSIIADPNLLVRCDSARVNVAASGAGFQITNIASNDLLNALGLKDGDIPVSLNSLPLGTFEEAASAFFSLSTTQPSSYTLTVIRNGVQFNIFVDVI